MFLQLAAIKNGLLPMPFPSDTAFSPVDPDEIGEVAAKLIGDYSGSVYHEPLHVVNLSGPGLRFEMIFLLHLLLESETSFCCDLLLQNLCFSLLC